MAQGLSYLTVRAGLSVGNIAQLSPYLPLEWCPPQVQRYVEALKTPGKIGIQLAGHSIIVLATIDYLDTIPLPPGQTGSHLILRGHIDHAPLRANQGIGTERAIIAPEKECLGNNIRSIRLTDLTRAVAVSPGLFTGRERYPVLWLCTSAGRTVRTAVDMSSATTVDSGSASFSNLSLLWQHNTNLPGPILRTQVYHSHPYRHNFPPN